MSQVKFYKITNANLNSLEIRDGQLVFVTDTKKVYLDSGDVRVPLNGWALSAGNKIDLEINGTNYVLNAKLYDSNNNLLSTSSNVDLPIEQLVMDVNYDANTKEIVITLQNGNITRVPVSSLIDGLVKNTDYATTSKAGIIKAGNQLNVRNTDGLVSAGTVTAANYDSASNDTFVSKGTLNNVINDRIYTKDEIDEQLGDATISGEGTNFSLDNCLAVENRSIKIKPSELEQVITTGKNLSQLILTSSSTKGGITYTPNNDGSVTINGTRTSGDELGCFSAYFEPSTTYYLMCFDKSTGEIFNSYNIQGQIGGIGEININRSFTTSSTISGTKTIGLKGQNNGVTINGTYFFMLCKQYDTDYEPYTGGNPAPSPDYPFDIHTISGDNEIKIQNKNLFTYSNFEKGKITSNGIVAYEDRTSSNSYTNDSITFTTTSSDGGMTSDFIFANKSTKYILNAIFPFGIDITVAQYDQNKNQIVQQKYTNKTTLFSFITGENTNYIRVDFRSRTGATTITLKNLQLEKSETATTYVEGKTQSLPLNLGVENLFNPTLLSQEDDYNTYDSSTGLWTTTSLGGYYRSILYRASGSGASKDINKIIKVKPNTDYTIKFYDFINNGSASNNYLDIQQYDNTGTKITDIRKNYFSNITTENNCEYIDISRVENVGTFSFSKIMLVEGTYTEDTFPSFWEYGTEPLEYSKIGDYEDEFYLATSSDTGLTAGKWYLKKNIGKVVFDGSESWGYAINMYNNNRAHTSITLPVISNVTQMSNYATYKQNTYNYGVLGDFSLGTSRLYVIIPNDMTDTQWKTKLATNNLIVCYPSSAPTYIPLNNTLQSQLNKINEVCMFNGVNNISISKANDLLPIVSLEAYTDTPNGSTLYNNEKGRKNATHYADGLMSKEDKIKLDNISNEANKTEIEQTISNGTKIGSVTIDDVQTNLYTPDYTGENSSRTIENIIELTSIDGTLKDAPMPMKLAPSELEQETTTGSNLQKYNVRSTTASAVNYNCDSTGQVTISGTASANSQLALNQTGNEMTLEAGTYVIKLIGILGNINTIYVKINNQDMILTLDSNNEVSFTISETSSVRTLFSIVYQITYSANFYTTLAKDTATTERYTGGNPAPNPEFPMDIHTISGDNEIRVVNKNLFTGNYSQFDNIGGTGTSYAYFKLPDDEDTYTLTLIAKNSFTGTSSTYFGFTSIGGGSGTNSWLIKNGTSVVKGDVLTYSTSTLRYISLYTKSANTLQTLMNNFDIILEKSSSYTSYVAHQEQSLPLNLGDLEYSKIGDYEDEFVLATGKNLCDGVFEQGNTANSSNMTRIRSKNTIPIEKGKSYTLSYHGLTSNLEMVINTNFSSSYGWYRYEDCGNDITWVSTNNSITFRATNSGYLSIVVKYTNGTNITPNDNIDLNKFQLEENSLPTDFEPYNLEDGKWYLKKNISKIVLDGSENWGINSGFNNVFNIDRPIGMKSAETSIICDSIKYIGSEYYSSQDYVIAVGSKLNIKNVNYATVENFKNWLSMQNITMCFPLATPKYILLNDTLQSQLTEIYNWTKTYQDQTNISQVNNDLPFNITATVLNNNVDGRYEAMLINNENTTNLIGNISLTLDKINGEEV